MKALHNIYCVYILFLTPLILIYFEVFRLENRIYFLIALTLYSVIGIFADKLDRRESGWRWDNTFISMAIYMGAAAIVVAAIEILAALSAGPEIIKPNEYGQHFSIANLTLISFAQEIMFRSYLIPKLKKHYNSSLLAVLISSVLFGLMHIIFDPPFVLFILTAMMGIIWGAIYLRFPNVVSATIAHSIVNFMFVSHCLITSFPQC